MTPISRRVFLKLAAGGGAAVAAGLGIKYACGDLYAKETQPMTSTAPAAEPLSLKTPGHPRLYFTAADLPRLRGLRTDGVHARIWQNMAGAADACLKLPLRKDWIAPVSPDPIYLNLYDRFYGIMRDVSVMEHLSFAFAYSGEKRYLDAARAWTLSCARIWGHEADGAPDASKAYAVMRLLKGLATAYDLLYAELAERERTELRDTMAAVGAKYAQWYKDNPTMGTIAQGKHHASVEVTSFGILAMALMGEAPAAGEWLDLAVGKHVDSLLPHALTPSGASEEGLTFWTSTMQYRLMFMDALRRVTGLDLFARFKEQMTGRLAMAKVAFGCDSEWDQGNQSVIMEPDYAQLTYWSPVLLYLAREYRRPIYQYLAMQDRRLGGIQDSRYVTPNGEKLIFDFGGYEYAWYDATVPAEPEPGLPRAFLFAETEEAYIRDSWVMGGIVAGVRQGQVVIHAGGRAVMVELTDPAEAAATGKTLSDLAVEDGEAKAIIRCHGAGKTPFAEQTLDVVHPGVCTLTRRTAGPVRWWCHDVPTLSGQSLAWPDGTTLRVVKGKLSSMADRGYDDRKIVGMGKLKCADPSPRSYPMVTAQPEGGELQIEVRAKAER